jgi:hypothetical protein
LSVSLDVQGCYSDPCPFRFYSALMLSCSTGLVCCPHGFYGRCPSCFSRWTQDISFGFALSDTLCLRQVVLSVVPKVVCPGPVIVGQGLGRLPFVSGHRGLWAICLLASLYWLWPCQFSLILWRGVNRRGHPARWSIRYVYTIHLHPAYSRPRSRPKVTVSHSRATAYANVVQIGCTFHSYSFACLGPRW